MNSAKSMTSDDPKLRKFTKVNETFTCENCDSGSLEILSGRELDIESIEIAQKDDHVS